MNSDTNQRDSKKIEKESEIDNLFREQEEEENRNINSYENENIIIEFNETEKKWEKWIDYQLMPEKGLREEVSFLVYMKEILNIEEINLSFNDTFVDFLQSEDGKQKMIDYKIDNDKLNESMETNISLYQDYLLDFQIENEDRDLILKLDNGTTKIFRNNLETEHVLNMYLPSINYYLVHTKHIEGERKYVGLPYLINKSNGFQIQLWNRPNISPSLNKIVVVNSAIGLYTKPDMGFQIFSITPDSLTLDGEFLFKRDDIQPSFSEWENDSTLYLKLYSDGTDGSYMRELSVVRVTYKK